MNLKRNFTCPICDGSVKVTLENGVTCCYECGYVYDTARYETQPRVKIVREDNTEFRKKSLIERGESRENKINRILDEISNFLNIDDFVRKEALRISLKAVKKKKGRTDPYVLVSTSILIASREAGRPKSIGELLRALKELGRKAKVRDFIKTSKLLEVKVRFKRDDFENYVDTVLTHVLNDAEVLRRVSSDVNVNRIKLKIRKRAIEILEKSPKRWIYGKRPYSIVAAAIYVADMEDSIKEGRNRLLSQRILAKYVNLSEYTIRERVIDLYKLGLTFLNRTRKEEEFLTKRKLIAEVA